MCQLYIDIQLKRINVWWMKGSVSVVLHDGNVNCVLSGHTETLQSTPDVRKHALNCIIHVLN